jgi:hypothetical protein
MQRRSAIQHRPQKFARALFAWRVEDARSTLPQPGADHRGADGFGQADLTERSMRRRSLGQSHYHAERAGMSMMPIEIELLRHSLASICDEMYVAIMRGAYSTNIEERRDHSAAIFDSHGRVVVQGESLPLHIASMLGLIDVVLERYGSIAFSRATCSSPTTRLPAADRISRGRAAGARLPQRRAGPVRERHRAPCGHRRNGAGRHDRDLSGGSANSADSIDRQGTDRRGGPYPATH